MRKTIKVVTFFKSPIGTKTWYFLIATTLIKWFTRSKYYHTEIIIGDTLVAATIKNGVIKRKVNVKAYERYLKGSAKVQTIYVDDLTETKVLVRANKFVGKPYDWLGILLSQIIPLNIDLKKSVFCSELGTDLLKLSKVKKYLPERPEAYDPGELVKAIDKYLRSQETWVIS